MARIVTPGRVEYTCTVHESRLVTVTYNRTFLADSQEAANLVMNNDMAQLWADIEDTRKGHVTIGVVQRTIDPK